MFERDVIIDGTVYNSHRVGGIGHALDDASTVIVQHVKGDVFDANWMETQHRHELDWGLTPEQAEEWLLTLPEYAEYVDPVENLIDELASMLDDEQASEVPQAFKDWAPNVGYSVGDRRRYGDGLYKCLIAHTSVAGQTPDVAVSLWACILNPNPDVIPVWVQPDSTNPYMMGDQVYYPDADGPVYESDQDYNVFRPDVAGWHVVGGEPEEEGPSAWNQPDSSTPYMMGDRVTHDGKVWESIYDYNVYEPGIAGWVVVE